MQQESTSARAGVARAATGTTSAGCGPFDEIQAAIDGLTPATILEHLDRYPAKDLTVVTLGPEPLTMPSDVDPDRRARESATDPDRSASHRRLSATRATCGF